MQSDLVSLKSRLTLIEGERKQLLIQSEDYSQRIFTVLKELGLTHNNHTSISFVH
jgi:hypothetical protein